MTKRRTLIAATLCALQASGAFAGDLQTLEQGFYLPKEIGCSGIGGAAEMYFDGANLSGHYQLCRTTKRSEPDVYTSVCVEAQGPNQPKLEDIDKDPDKTSVTQKIEVRSKTVFVLKGVRYNHCAS